MLGGSLLVIAALSLINLSPDLSHLDATLLSGTQKGNYFAIGKTLEKLADSDNGNLKNVSTKGSVDNLEQLVAGSDQCNVHFALVQDGVPVPKGSSIELIARLPKSETVFILGKHASALSSFESMRGMRVGVGPAGGGTAYLAHSIFESEDFAPLALQLEYFEVEEQMQRIASGELDLALFVLDEDSQLIRNAMRSGMQIASFSHLGVIARRFDFIGQGQVEAGQFDPLSVIPKNNRDVLKVDTLLVGNGCASRTETIALLSLLQLQFPTLLRHNRVHSGSIFFPTSSDAQEFIVNGGPEWADSHVPWLVNIMPLGNWFYVIMAISILFNLMTSLHKFRLWRVDAIRDKTQQVFRDLLGTNITPAEIYQLPPEAKHLKQENIDKIDEALYELDDLRQRCRKFENSPMVPMGQELAYRFQEEQMELSLTAVRDFRRRIDEMRAAQNTSAQATPEETKD